jgi:hypothetical protein
MNAALSRESRQSGVEPLRWDLEAVTLLQIDRARLN